MSELKLRFGLIVSGSTLVSGSIIPITNNSWNLGSPLNFWNTGYITNISASTISASRFVGNLTGSAQTAISSSYAATASYIGNGTNNYLPKWNNNALTATSSIYDDNTNVGIGTSTPAYKLQISGTMAPTGDAVHALGSEINRFADFHAVQSTIGAFFESGLKTKGMGKNETGTIVVWKNGTLVPCNKESDEFVMGVVKKGKDEPIILGAETILVTGKVEEGDYIVTSEKTGHGKATKRGWILKADLFGKVIAQALESANGESSLIKAMIRKM